MKTEQTTAPTISGLEQKTISVFFISDQELKEFYLKEALLLSPQACTTKRTEFEILNILYKEIKKILSFLSQASNYPWDKSMLNLHTVCAPYLVQDAISAKERLQVSTELTTHLRFLTSLMANRNIVGELFTLYNRHYANVGRLIQSFPEAPYKGVRAE